MDLPGRLLSHADFGQLAQRLLDGEPASVEGVWGSSCALTAAAVFEAGDRFYSLLVVLPQAGDIDAFVDDWELFSTVCPLTLPAWEADPGETVARDEIFGVRLRTLRTLAAGPVDSRQTHDRRFEEVAAKEMPSGPPLMGFRRKGVQGSGELGDGATSGAPARAQRERGEVALSQRERGEAAAARHVVVTSIQSLLQPTPSPAGLAASVRKLAVGDRVDPEELSQWLAKAGFHSTSAVELPGEFSRRGGILDIYAADADWPVRLEFFGDEIESIREFDPTTQRSRERLTQVDISSATGVASDRGYFTDYLPADTVVFLHEPSRQREAAAAYLERLEDLTRVHGTQETYRRLAKWPTLSVSSIAEGAEENSARLPLESATRFSGQYERVKAELELAAGRDDVFLVCPTEAEIRRLRELLADSRPAQEDRLSFFSGRLSRGFRLTDENLLLISGDEIFHRAEPLRRQRHRHRGRALDSFLDLKEGDLVVHLAHGIGRYRGVTKLEKRIDGARHVEDHLEIEFYGRTKVYVPATKIDLIQKYIGGKKSRPSLAKIGGKSWIKQKKAAERAAYDIAAELLELQAARQARPGIVFSDDTPWQHAFDGAFPYRETDDQLSAIDAIKLDMQRGRPMDRLLCGDVGFGKTELAIRAAFKAIDNGFQVAVLTPTTVLAEQHYHTFRDRMAEFPFTIRRLSRFCSTQEERDTIKGIKSGGIDLVIGTHRLASKDVKFANVGLVVIDEEQRFGVDVKERLKSLKQNVDVLTLSATPIPRTLHMSLVGLRDISNLQTAPEDRVSVETRVTRFDEKLIRHACLRELNRGGQIFFVHNRVEDIASIRKKLKEIVPEARIRVGHGQMHEDDLEQVMVDFVAHKFDLLLATTIVESGLDIPNANTIFIDEADRYGLSDLHQLRGRVGRYKHQAYCYLLIDEHKRITPNAARRLRAIEEFSEMGAGFAIAMQDLEIRGAGNLLGTEQSGHIATVGYELYCTLLENAVRRMKKLPPRLKIDVEVDLPGETHLPDDYVGDLRMKIDLYRRLSRVSSEEEIQQFAQETADRFGRLPPAVDRLVATQELKLYAAMWGVRSISLEDKYLKFEYTDRGRIEQLARRLGGKRLRIADHESAVIPLRKEMATPELIHALARVALRPE